jgi:hypothetical protein
LDTPTPIWFYVLQITLYLWSKWYSFVQHCVDLWDNRDSFAALFMTRGTMQFYMMSSCCRIFTCMSMCFYVARFSHACPCVFHVAGFSHVCPRVFHLAGLAYVSPHGRILLVLSFSVFFVYHLAENFIPKIITWKKTMYSTYMIFSNLKIYNF